MMLLPPEAIQQAYNFKLDAKTHGYDLTFKELEEYFNKGESFNVIVKEAREKGIKGTSKLSKEDLEKHVEEEIKARKEAEADRVFESAIMEKLIDNTVVEIPDAMIEREIDNQINEYNYRLQMQGMSLDMYMQYTGMDMATLRQSYKEGTEKQVKLRLALEKIIELEKIEISDEDVETELKTYADSYGMKLEEVKKYVPVEDVKADLGCRKAMDIVKDNAKAGAAKKTAAKAEEAAEEKPAKKTAAKKETAEKKPAAKKTTSKKKTEEAKAE